MNTQIEKGRYAKPQLERVKLDNAISLALESTPPIEPGELMLAAQDLLSSDPFNF